MPAVIVRENQSESPLSVGERARVQEAGMQRGYCTTAITPRVWVKLPDVATTVMG